MITSNSAQTRVVISQSMYFPWVGLLEQVRLCDLFVHYDDVQLARGFCNRVQVKTSQGMKWMTIPLRQWRRGQRICDVVVDDSVNWRRQHRDILRQAYGKAPFCSDMLELIDEVFSTQCKTLADVARSSLLALVRYYELQDGVVFRDSSTLDIGGTSTQRLLDLCLKLNAQTYITGHGARNYLDHELFDDAGIRVEYMKYESIPYSQLYGDFTPFVTGLDLVANCGRYGKQWIVSKSIHWKEFINES